MARPAIIPDRVCILSLGVSGDGSDRQIKHAINVLEREGFRVAPTSDEAILVLEKEIEMREQLGLDETTDDTSDKD